MGTVKTQVNKGEEEENGASPEDSVQGCTKTSINYLQTQVIFCSFFKFSKILKLNTTRTQDSQSSLPLITCKNIRLERIKLRAVKLT